MDEVTGEWRKLHCDELHDLQYRSDTFEGDQFADNETAGTCVHTGLERNVCRGFCGEPERKITLK